jgi:DNA-binding HxlR family transcriptional regulator
MCYSMKKVLMEENPMCDEICQYGCLVEATLDVICSKWKGVILYKLLERKRREKSVSRKVTFEPLAAISARR